MHEFHKHPRIGEDGAPNSLPAQQPWHVIVILEPNIFFGKTSLISVQNRSRNLILSHSSKYETYLLLLMFFVEKINAKTNILFIVMVWICYTIN